MFYRFGALLVFLILLPGCHQNPHSPPPPHYTLLDLGTLGGGNGFGASLNNNGQLAGRLGKDINDTQPFLWTHGKVIKIGPHGGRMGIASQINDKGQVCGTVDPGISSGSDNRSYGFLWQNHQLVRLDTLAVKTFSAAGINSKGDIVGTAQFGPNRSGTFLWRQGTIQEFSPPSGSGSIACAVNDAGQIVGTSGSDAVVWMSGPASAKIIGPGCARAINNHGQVVGNSGADAFLWQNGLITDLGQLGTSGNSVAFGINDQGQIVGDSRPAVQGGKYNHAVLWHNGQMYDLNSLIIPSGSKYELAVGNAVNNRGQILCSAILGGKSHTVILTPTK